MNKTILITLLLLIARLQLSASQDSSVINEISEGNIYFNKSVSIFRSDLDSAIYYMELAHPALKKEKEWPKYIECFSALSFFHHTNNNFDAFRYYAELALEEGEKHLDSNNIKFGDIHNNLYGVYSLLGNYRKGIESLHKSLEIRKKNNEHDVQLSFGYQNLGHAYSRLGDSQKAIEYLKHSIKLREESDSLSTHDIHFADSYSSLADAYHLTGSHENSIEYYKKSLSVLNHTNHEQSQHAQNLKIIALLQIAENLLLLEQTDKANKYLTQVFKLHNAGIQTRLPTSLYLKARFHFENKNYALALKNILEANAVSYKNNNESTPPLLAKRFKLKGDIYDRLNQPDSSLTAYNEGLLILGIAPEDQKIKDKNFTNVLAQHEALNLLSAKSNVLKSRAIAMNAMADWVECFDSYLNTVRLIREMRTGIATTESKNALAANSMKVYEEALEVAHHISRFGKDDKILHRVFEIIESNKALLLLESYNQQLALGKVDIPQEVLNLEYDLKIEKAYYAKEISNEQRSEDLDEGKILSLKNSYQKVNQKYDSLMYRLNTISPDFTLYKNQISPIPLSTLQTKLANENNLIIEYFYGSEYLFALLIEATNVELIKLDKSYLSERITDLREELSFEASMTSGNEGFERYYQTSLKIYNQLFKPTLTHVGKEQTNITIIPDGYISSIPFDILISGHQEGTPQNYSPKHLNYLINDYNISYAYSSTLYCKSQESTSLKSLEKLIAFAPAFGGETAQERNCECDGIQLQNLNCNVSESETISHLFSGNMYTNEAANKETFLSKAKNYKIIHIASHACVDQEDGMSNQIFLSDGGITNYEIYNSNLNAELTVLSACNTGIGEIQKGEGVLNLAKGFLMGGSKSVLMSLWSVNDCTTSKLMEYFYTNLKNGKSKDKSIRDARLQFLNNASKLHSHPYYWGAFVHYGKNDPLAESNPITSFYWIILALLFFGIVFFLIKKKSDHSM